jgi:hypothetical protein
VVERKQGGAESPLKFCSELVGYLLIVTVKKLTVKTVALTWRGSA